MGEMAGAMVEETAEEMEEEEEMAEVVVTSELGTDKQRLGLRLDTIGYRTIRLYDFIVFLRLFAFPIQRSGPVYQC
jgi:hypothetical protein